MMKVYARQVSGMSLTTVLSIIVFCALPAGAFELVKDINQGTVSRPVYAGNLRLDTPQGTFLVMEESSHGAELWSSDNTPQGTRLVKDINPGWGNSIPSTFVRIGNNNIFMADDGVHGFELWRTDGTASGTFMLKDIGPGPQSGIGQFRPKVLNEVLYFAADDNVSGNELWRTDGTREGTYLVADIEQGYASSYPSNLATVGDHLFFLVQGDIWLTDGTGVGTRKVVDLTVYRCCQPVGNAIFFTAADSVHGGELWRVDGDGSNLRMVANLNTKPLGNGQDYGSDPYFMFVRDDALIFIAYIPIVPANGQGSECRMYRADASGQGVTELANLGSSGCPSPAGIDLPGGNLFYVHDSNPYASDPLWVTDGTPAGTVPLDLGFEFATTDPSPVKVAYGPNREAYFFGRTPPVGPTVFADKIWRTDGTRAGTRVFADLSTRSKNFEIAYLNGRLYFDSGFDGTHSAGDELWTSDGTTAGTFMVRDVNIVVDSSITDLRAVNGKLQFFATGVGAGRELWSSDGTLDGTINLITSNVGSAGNGSSNVTFAAQLGSRALFAADRGAGNEGHELLATDGTTGGTSPVRALFDGGPSDPENFLLLGDQLLFVANDAQRHRGLWRSDGTSAGTVPLQTISAIDTSQVLLGDEGTIVGNVAYFTAAATAVGDSYRELWRTDGTQAGTFRVPGDVGQRVSILGGNGTHLLYQALSNNAMHLWSWDGTQAQIVTAADNLKIASGGGATLDGRICFRAWDTSPQRLDVWCASGHAGDLLRATNFNGTGVSAGQLRTLGNKLLVNVPGSSATSGLYVTQGSPSSTQRISAEQIVSAKLYSTGQLAFVSDSGKLMLTDGTSTGTRNLLEGVTVPGALAGCFGVLGNYVIFMVDDPVRGAVIWRTDGTPSGTRYLADLDLGTLQAQAGVGQFFTLGDRLLFSGYRTSIGNELWSITATDPNASDDSAAATGGVESTMNVLDNDADFDGTLNATSVVIVAQPTHGSAAVNAATGAITYTPVPTYSGIDSLTYRVSDDQGRQSNIATVSYQVTASSTPPTIPPTTPPSGGVGGGGGGGALSLELLGLMLLMMSRMGANLRGGRCPAT